MARGTFKKIVLSTGKKLSDVRTAFGRTAADLAKRVLNSLIDRYVADANRRSILKSKPGDLWLVTVRHVYRAVARVMKDKLARNALTIEPDGTFNITLDEISPHLTDLEADFRQALAL